MENLIKFSKYTRINNYTIKLEKGKQPLFWPNISTKIGKVRDIKNLH